MHLLLFILTVFSSAAAQDSASGPCMVTLKKGENLHVIARQHGVTVEELIEWNELENPSLIVKGQNLYVERPPCGEAEVVKAREGTVSNGQNGGSIIVGILCFGGFSGAALILVLIFITVVLWKLDENRARRLAHRRELARAHRRELKEEAKIEYYKSYKMFLEAVGDQFSDEALEYAHTIRGRRTKRPLNFCIACAHEWYPRGSDISDICPRCEEEYMQTTYIATAHLMTNWVTINNRLIDQVKARRKFFSCGGQASELDTSKIYFEHSLKCLGVQSKWPIDE